MSSVRDFGVSASFRRFHHALGDPRHCDVRSRLAVRRRRRRRQWRAARLCIAVSSATTTTKSAINQHTQPEDAQHRS
jgi:hypothetical protein